MHTIKSMYAPVYCPLARYTCMLLNWCACAWYILIIDSVAVKTMWPDYLWHLPTSLAHDVTISPEQNISGKVLIHTTDEIDCFACLCVHSRATIVAGNMSSEVTARRTNHRQPLLLNQQSGRICSGRPQRVQSHVICRFYFGLAQFQNVVCGWMKIPGRGIL